MKEAKSEENGGQCMNLFAKSLMELKEVKDQVRKDYKRGPYKSYTREFKQQVVELHKEMNLSAKEISRRMNVPIKNITRWCEEGIERKEGAGRKRLDPEMEEKLFEDLRELYPTGSEIEADLIKAMALARSNVSDFKASRGWILSFIERYSLGSKYKIS